MTYRGTVKDGVIVLESGTRLTEGAVVEVREVAGAQEPTWAEKWKDFIGKCEGLPSDFAENHDHYIHGTPKGIDRK
jgi:hypothetical protein